MLDYIKPASNPGRIGGVGIEMSVFLGSVDGENVDSPSNVGGGRRRSGSHYPSQIQRPSLSLWSRFVVGDSNPFEGKTEAELAMLKRLMEVSGFLFPTYLSREHRKTYWDGWTALDSECYLARIKRKQIITRANELVKEKGFTYRASFFKLDSCINLTLDQLYVFQLELAIPGCLKREDKIYNLVKNDSELLDIYNDGWRHGGLRLTLQKLIKAVPGNSEICGDFQTLLTDFNQQISYPDEKQRKSLAASKKAMNCFDEAIDEAIRALVYKKQ